MKTLCIDIGGSRIKWAVIGDIRGEDDLRAVRVDSIRTLGWLNESLPELLNSDNRQSINHAARNIGPFDCVSVGICEEVDAKGRIGGHLLTRGVPTDLADRWRNLVGKEVRLVNDAVAWMLGATRYASYAGRSISRPALAVILGTGMGLAILDLDGTTRAQEFDERFLLREISKAAGLNADFDYWDIHSVVGRPFMDWIERERPHWSSSDVRREFSSRVAALLRDVMHAYGTPRTVILGGGNSDYFSLEQWSELFPGIALLPLTVSELHGVNPDAIPLLGCAHQ